MSSPRDIVFPVLEVNEVPDHLPKGCNIIFPNPDRLHEILLRINPNSGYWKGGTFEFEISVPLEYNIMVTNHQSCIRNNASIYLLVPGVLFFGHGCFWKNIECL